MDYNKKYKKYKQKYLALKEQYIFVQSDRIKGKYLALKEQYIFVQSDRIKGKYLAMKKQFNFTQGNHTLDENQININNIKQTTKDISIYRPIESPNLFKVKKYIIDKLNELGLSTSLQSFKQTIQNKSYNFSNIISYNKNLSKKYILLGAHIDSPNIEGSESAIDSASSIAIILELARCILNVDKDYPLLIVFFDGEEAIDGPWSSDNTLIGSTYFANNYDLSKIEIVYILDLIGGSIEDNKIFHYLENPNSFSIIKKLNKINQKYSKNIFVNPEIKSSNKIMEDDHIPFKNKGIKYINFIPPIYPNTHHTINDTFENLNWEYIELFSRVFLEYLIIN